MSRLHILVVRDAPFQFAPKRDAALDAKTKPLRPIKNRVCPSFNPDLIKPSVTRLRQSLDKVEGTSVALLPVVKNGVADLQSRHAIEFVVRPDGAALQRGYSHSNFESRTRRIRRTERPRQQRDV